MTCHHFPLSKSAEMKTDDTRWWGGTLRQARDGIRGKTVYDVIVEGVKPFTVLDPVESELMLGSSRGRCRRYTGGCDVGLTGTAQTRAAQDAGAVTHLPLAPLVSV